MPAAAWAYLSFGLIGVFALAWWGMIQRVAIGRGIVLLRCLAGAAMVCGLVALTRSPGLLAGLLAGVSLLIGSAFFLLGSFARQSDQAPSVEVGRPLPSFEALDHEGRLFRSELLHGRPALIKLFRGHW